MRATEFFSHAWIEPVAAGAEGVGGGVGGGAGAPGGDGGFDVAGDGEDIELRATNSFLPKQPARPQPQRSPNKKGRKGWKGKGGGDVILAQGSEWVLPKSFMQGGALAAGLGEAADPTEPTTMTAKEPNAHSNGDGSMERLLLSSTRAVGVVVGLSGLGAVGVSALTAAVSAPPGGSLAGVRVPQPALTWAEKRMLDCARTWAEREVKRRNDFVRGSGGAADDVGNGDYIVDNDRVGGGAESEGEGSVLGDDGEAVIGAAGGVGGGGGGGLAPPNESLDYPFHSPARMKACFAAVVEIQPGEDKGEEEEEADEDAEDEEEDAQNGRKGEGGEEDAEDEEDEEDEEEQRERLEAQVCGWLALLRFTVEPTLVWNP